MTPLDRHFHQLRAALRGEGASLYARLVARQHAQPLESMFARLRAAIGARSFDLLVSEFRRVTPPRDPNPARWAEEFAAFVAERSELPQRQRDEARYDALCIGTLIAPDAPDNPRALAVAAFHSDPRPTVAPARGAEPHHDAAIVLLFFRDPQGKVRTREVSRMVAAAVVLVRREAQLAELLQAGVGELELATGMTWLRAQGLTALAASPLGELAEASAGSVL